MRKEAVRILLKLMLLLGGLALAGLSYAQISDWNAVVAAGKKEGRIVLYTQTIPAMNDRIKADFEKANPGFTLEVIRLLGQALTTKVDQEQAMGGAGADVVIEVNSLWTRTGGQSGWFKTPLGPLSKTWPRQYLIPGGAVVIGVEPEIMAYNPALSKKPLTTYRDLLAPEYKGRISVQPLSVGPNVYAWYEWLEQTQGPEFLKQLAAQQPKVNSAVPSTQSVAAGELLATSFTEPSIVDALVAQGAPVKAVIPQSVQGYQYYAAVLNSSKRPNAAQVFLNYLMSRGGQAAVVGQKQMASPLPGIEGSLDLSTITIPDLTKYTPEVMDAYTKKWNAIFAPK